MKKLSKSIIAILFMSCFLFLLKADVKAFNNAVELPLNETWVSQTIEQDSDIKYFKVEIPSDGKLEMKFQAFREHTWFHFINEDLEDSDAARYFRVQLNSGSLNSPSSQDYSLYLSKGTYYIKVGDNLYNAFGTVGDVRIKAKFTSGCTTDTEPNDTWTEADVLAEDEKVRGMLTIKDDREDFYKITVEETGEVVVTFTTYAEEVGFYVYNDEYVKISQFALHSGGETDPHTGEWRQALEPGTYYIKVIDWWANKDPGVLYEMQWRMNFPVQSVTLNKQKMVLDIGKNAKLTATVLPENATNKNLTWSSSNSKVVVVDTNGNITAKTAGTAVITATSKDGTNISSSCTVTVRKPITPPKKVTGLTVKKANCKPNSVVLSWSAVSGAYKYRVYVYNAAKKAYKVYTNTTKTSVKITGLKAETKHKFRVQAYKEGYDGKYVFGEKSNIYSAYTAPKKLAAPKSFAVKRVKKNTKNHSVKLSWKKVSGATGYKVYYKQSGTWKLLKTTKSTSFSTTVAKGKIRQYKVAAYRTKNNLTTIGNYSVVKKYTAK